MTAIGFLLVGTAAPWWLFADHVGAYGLWLAAGLTLITGFDYLVVGLRPSSTATPASRAAAKRAAGRPATAR